MTVLVGTTGALLQATVRGSCVRYGGTRTYANTLRAQVMQGCGEQSAELHHHTGLFGTHQLALCRTIREAT